ncbi:hypothetical protein JCM5296_003801 [Sporobolomyces johnsonii]
MSQSQEPQKSSSAPSQSTESFPQQKEAKQQETSSAAQKEVSTRPEEQASPLVEQQLAAVESIFKHLKLDQFDQLEALLSDQSDFLWELRPLSLYPDVFTKPDLSYTKKEMLGFWRSFKDKMMRELRSETTTRNVTQGKDNLAVRVNRKVRRAPIAFTFVPVIDRRPSLYLSQGTTPENRPFDEEMAMFVNFEPGTDKIVKAVQFFDSTTTTNQAKRHGWRW